MESTPFLIFCGIMWDHLRSNLGIISSPGIIYGPGSFAGLYRSQSYVWKLWLCHTLHLLFLPHYPCVVDYCTVAHKGHNDFFRRKLLTCDCNLLTCDRNLIIGDRNLIIGDHNLLAIVQGHKDGWSFRVRLFHCNDNAKQLLHSFKLFPGVGWGPPCKYIQGTGILQRKT